MCYFRCDLKTVINYLKKEATNFGFYIAHGVNEIHRNSRVEDWYYIHPKLHVADDLTRFTCFQNLIDQSRWCTGPEFLTRNDNQPVNINLIDEITEVVKQPTLPASTEDISLPIQTASKINNLTAKSA